jgi:hypothetical protein
MRRFTYPTAKSDAKTSNADNAKSEEVLVILRQVHTSAEKTLTSPARREGQVLAACAKC